jgi:expansin (peptidoglycan-binding protein)
MFDPSPDDMNVAALSSQQWDGSAWCGACAEVTGPSGSVRVRIVDLCPEKPARADILNIRRSRGPGGQSSGPHIDRIVMIGH